MEGTRGGNGVERGWEEVLRGLPCLAGADGDRVEELVRRSSPRRLARGSVIVREKGVADATILVLEGLVRLVRASDGGRSIGFWLVGPGQCFCFAPPGRSVRSPFSALCASDVRLVRIDAGEWSRFVGCGQGVEAHALECYAERIHDLSALVGDLAHVPVRTRIEACLWKLACDRGQAGEEGVVVERGATHEEIASACGTAREVVTRTLAALREDGVVRTARGRITILDPGLLAERVGRPAPGCRSEATGP